jgi:hypothetical protein
MAAHRSVWPEARATCLSPATRSGLRGSGWTRTHPPVRLRFGRREPLIVPPGTETATAERHDGRDRSRAPPHRERAPSGRRRKPPSGRQHVTSTARRRGPPAPPGSPDSGWRSPAPGGPGRARNRRGPAGGDSHRGRVAPGGEVVRHVYAPAYPSAFRTTRVRARRGRIGRQGTSATQSSSSPSWSPHGCSCRLHLHVSDTQVTVEVYDGSPSRPGVRPLTTSRVRTGTACHGAMPGTALRHRSGRRGRQQRARDSGPVTGLTGPRTAPPRPGVT